MGIGITSNNMALVQVKVSRLFQSPMGIGITSNPFKELMEANSLVSIPNGDRHYLEQERLGV